MYLSYPSIILLSTINVVFCNNFYRNIYRINFIYLDTMWFYVETVHNFFL